MSEIDTILPRFSVQSSFVSDCARMARKHNLSIPTHAGGWSHDGLLRIMTYNVFLWHRPAPPSGAGRNSSDNKQAIILTILRASPDVAVLQEVVETCSGYKGSNCPPTIAPLFEREGYSVYFQPLLHHGPPGHYMGNMLLVRSDLISSGRVKTKPLCMQFEHPGEPRGYVCVAIELQPAEPRGDASRVLPQTNAAPSASSASASASASACAPCATSAAASPSPLPPPPRLHFYGFHLDCWDETEATRMNELDELLQLVVVDADDAVDLHEQAQQQILQLQRLQKVNPPSPAVPPPPIFAVLAGDFNAVRQADYVHPLPAAASSLANGFSSSAAFATAAAAAAPSLSSRPVWSMLRDVNRALLHQDDLETPTLVHDSLARKGWMDSFTAAAATATGTGTGTTRPPPNWTAWSGTAVDFCYVKSIQIRSEGQTTKNNAGASAAPSSSAAAAAFSAGSPASSLRLPVAGSYVLYSAESDHVPIIVDIDLHACARMTMGRAHRSAAPASASSARLPCAARDRAASEFSHCN